MKDRDAALDTMAREELGFDPDELGSPWSAAVSSLLAFALSAVVIVLPWLNTVLSQFLDDPRAMTRERRSWAYLSRSAADRLIGVRSHDGSLSFIPRL